MERNLEMSFTCQYFHHPFHQVRRGLLLGFVLFLLSAFLLLPLVAAIALDLWLATLCGGRLLFSFDANIFTILIIAHHLGYSPADIIHLCQFVGGLVRAVG